MIPFALIKNWKLIVGGVAIVAVAGTIGLLSWQLKDAKAAVLDAHRIIGQKDGAIATLEGANAANIEFANIVQADAKKNIAAMQRTVDAKDKALSESNKIIWSLRNVPPQPLSPVLLCYLEQLRDIESSVEAVRAGEGVREAGGAAGTDRLQTACVAGP